MLGEEIEEADFRGKNFDVLYVLKKPTFEFADRIAKLYNAEPKKFRKLAVRIMVLVVSSISFGLWHLQNALFDKTSISAVICQVFHTTLMGFFLQQLSLQVDGVFPLWIAYFSSNYMTFATHIDPVISDT